MKKKIFLIGGAGYIGSVIAEYLYKKKIGYEVIIVDKQIYHKQNYNYKKVKFINCEIQDIYKKIHFQKSDIVIFLAGLVGDPITKKYNNISSIVNYSHIKKFFIKIKKISLDRILFISTCSNYGIQNDSLLDENCELKPISQYAKDKVRIENLILKLNTRIPICIFRFSTAFGFSERMRLDLTINDFCYQILYKKKLTVYDPETWRPYCHVKDFARAVEKFIVSPVVKIRKQVYNIGSTRNNYRKKDIIKKIKNLLDKKTLSTLKVKYISDSNDKRNYKVNFSKMEKILGLKIKYDLNYGIKEMIHIFKKKNFNKIYKDRGNFLIKKSFVNRLQKNYSN
jgi:nucleoside-diphosphate-sugar epimerase